MFFDEPLLSPLCTFAEVRHEDIILQHHGIGHSSRCRAAITHRSSDRIMEITDREAAVLICRVDHHGISIQWRSDENHDKLPTGSRKSSYIMANSTSMARAVHGSDLRSSRVLRLWILPILRCMTLIISGTWTWLKHGSTYNGRLGSHHQVHSLSLVCLPNCAPSSMRWFFSTQQAASGSIAIDGTETTQPDSK